MGSVVYRYTFDASVPMIEAEATLQLSIRAVQGLLGESIVRMDAAYSIDEQCRVCVVDAGTEVGRAICHIFTGFLTCEFGDDAFQVRSIPKLVNGAATAPA